MSEGVLPAANSVEQLIKQHERLIRRFIRRRSGHALLKRTTVEDLYQDTVAAAIESARQGNFTFIDHGSFVNWVLTIARRLMLQTMGRTANEPNLIRIRGPRSSGVGVPESGLRSPGRTPSSVVRGREGKAILMAAIRTLPERYQDVLMLYKIEQRPLAEVAAKMGCSRGAVCMMINRAMKLLRQRLPEP